MKILVLLFVLSLEGVTAMLAGDKADDTKDIQGTWLPVEADLGGQPMKAELLKNIILKLKSGKYEVTAEALDKGSYAMDPSAKPKTIDITGTEGPNAGKRILAIYELSGDRLRVCYGLSGSSRPTQFNSPRGTQNFLVTYKRKKG